MIIEGESDARMALECDGDEDDEFSLDRWHEEMARQRTLQRIGWKYWRCFADKWYMDKETIYEDLKNILAQNGIMPVGNQNKQEGHIICDSRVINEDILIDFSVDEEDSDENNILDGNENRLIEKNNSDERFEHYNLIKNVREAMNKKGMATLSINRGGACLLKDFGQYFWDIIKEKAPLIYDNLEQSTITEIYYNDPFIVTPLSATLLHHMLEKMPGRSIERIPFHLLTLQSHNNDKKAGWVPRYINQNWNDIPDIAVPQNSVQKEFLNKILEDDVEPDIFIEPNDKIGKKKVHHDRWMFIFTKEGKIFEIILGQGFSGAWESKLEKISFKFQDRSASKQVEEMHHKDNNLALICKNGTFITIGEVDEKNLNIFHNYFK